MGMAHHPPACCGNFPPEQSPGEATLTQERHYPRLRDFPAGTHVRIKEVRGRGSERSRLYSLGFTPGAVITFCGGGRNGCRVQLRDTCVVLDCSFVDSIICEPCEEGDRHG